MDQTVKERLVGMGVLLLLGVIFIPLVLDGNTADLHLSKQDNLQLPVPVAKDDGITHEMNFSDGNVRRLELPVPKNDKAILAEETNVETNPDTQSEKTEEVVKALPANGFIEDLPKSNIEKPQVTTTSEGGSISRNSAEVNETTNETTLKSSTSLNVKPSREEMARVSSGTNLAWVVQVGSFGNQVNAEKEVKKLKAKGFPAFLRRYKTAENKVLFRVRVGPEKERARAEKLAERLLKAKIKGQIVSDP